MKSVSVLLSNPFAAALLLGVFAFHLSSVRAGTPPPNIVLILADDMGWCDVGCFGGKAVPTPAIDSLANSGMKMTRFYAASAVCTPTRASVMTGRFPLRFNIRGIFPDNDNHLPRGTVTLPALLKENGYRTAHLGKWHLGGLHVHDATNRAASSIPGPREHGFDHYLCQIEEQPMRGEMIKERRLYREGGTCLIRNDQLVPESDPYYRMHFTDILGQEAVRMLEQFHSEKKPFFLNLWHMVPHTPLEPGSDPHWENTDSPGISDDQHRFRSMVAHMDATIGNLLQKLDQLRLRENTLIVFTSDNGGAHESDIGPLKGGKTDLHEGGIRVPLIANWQGQIPTGGTSSVLASTIDLLPTFCAAARVSAPAGAKVDGVSLLEHWRKNDFVKRSNPLFWQLDLMPKLQRHYPKPKPFSTEVAMEGNWKLLCRNAEPQELFDIETDLTEATNLFTAQPKMAAKLARSVRAFLDAPRNTGGFVKTDIPARNHRLSSQKQEP